MRDERGSVTIWMLGLSMLLLVLGGFSVDLWRVLAERRDLAGAADAASVAAGSAVDLVLYRSAIDRGELLDPVPLDPAVATDRALEAIRRSGVLLSAPPAVSFADGNTRVFVRLESEVPFTLLRLLSPAGVEGFTVTAEGVAVSAELG